MLRSGPITSGRASDATHTKRTLQKFQLISRVGRWLIFIKCRCYEDLYGPWPRSSKIRLREPLYDDDSSTFCMLIALQMRRCRRTELSVGFLSGGEEQLLDLIIQHFGVSGSCAALNRSSLLLGSRASNGRAPNIRGRRSFAEICRYARFRPAFLRSCTEWPPIEYRSNHH